MKNGMKLKKILVVSLILAICVSIFPTSAFAASSTDSSFDESYKIEKKVRIKIFGKKTRVKLKFGTIRVKGTYNTEDADNTVADIKIYFKGKLITEGEVDQSGASIGRGFYVTVKGFRFRVTPCVKYYPSHGSFGFTANVEGNGVDFDIPLITFGQV
ncbi:hypothetical protein R9X47_09060 [Wukongibacter baidiensis]|uniref:hypothetical protein n=1 Tax=Wukongibacter baidiensis TaxID=1723361 RepID=UPI003D7FB30A